MPYEFKAPLWVKILMGMVAVGLFSYTVIYTLYKERKNTKEFYNNEFSSKVVSSNSYEGRTIEFHLENGLKLYFFPPVNNKVIIGDIIQKKSETSLYNVLRKNKNGKYEFHSTHDFDKLG